MPFIVRKLRKGCGQARTGVDGERRILGIEIL
jgi:hypothetical protein